MLALPDIIHAGPQLRFPRVQQFIQAANEARAHHPPRLDGPKIAAFGIDCQASFCHPDGGLFVPGAVDDIDRASRWLIAHSDSITSTFFSLDTHHPYQIFHPTWWLDQDDNTVAPMTIIRARDVEAGLYRTADPAQHDRALEYCRRLEATGRFVLTVWPFHGLLGSVGHALMPSIQEAAIFHAAYRSDPAHRPQLVEKGTHPWTEHFSVFRPEVDRLGDDTLGGFNRPLFDALMRHDRVYVFGEAKSHCVASTLRDMVEHLREEDPESIAKIWVLEDATSPVPAPPLEPLPEEMDFPTVADRIFDELQAEGIERVKTRDPVP